MGQNPAETEGRDETVETGIGVGAALPRPRVDPLEVTVPMARSLEKWRSSASTRTPSDWEGDTGLSAKPVVEHTSIPLTGPHSATESSHHI